MAFANTRRALEMAEKDHIPFFAERGKLKGYAVYGRLSDFVLKDISIFAEKKRGGGVFAILYPHVYQWLKEYPKESDIFNEISGYENPTFKVYSGTGSLLIYIEDTRLLGKEIVLNLTKKTSLMRLAEDHDQTAIITWEKRKGTGEWQIIPTPMQEIKAQRIPKGADQYLQADSKGGITYTADPIGEAYLKSEWKGGVPVSSVNRRMQIERYSNAQYEWSRTGGTDLTPHPKGSLLYKYEGYVNKRKSKLGKYLARTKSVLAEKMDHDRMDRIASRLMREFSECMIENWDNYIGESGHKGSWFVNTFLDELAYADPKYKGNIDRLRKRIYLGSRKRTESFYKILTYDSRATEGTTRVCKDKWHYAACMIAKVAGVEFVRIQRNFDRCWNSFKIDSQTCFYLLLWNPYLLALIGEGMRYKDCVAISAVIQSREDEEPLIWSREDTKEMLYVLSVYRQYTKDSGYKDTLVSYGELLNKDVRISKMQENVEVRPEAEFIWTKPRDYYDLNIKTSEVPELFAKEFTPFEKPTDNPYKNKDRKPLQIILDKLCSTGLMLTIQEQYIPTYEAVMELSFLDWLHSRNSAEVKPIPDYQIEAMAKDWHKPLTGEQRQAASLSGYGTALIAGSVFDNFNEGSNKLTDTMDFFIHTLKQATTHEAVWIGDTYYKPTESIKHMPRLPYTEPIYFCETPQDMAVWSSFTRPDKPVAWLIEDMNQYSLWELYTFISCVRGYDKVFFIGDADKKAPAKGVSTFKTAQKIIPSIDLGLPRDLFECTGSARSEVPKYQHLIAKGTRGYEKAKMFDKRILRADDEVEMEELIKEIISKSTGQLPKGEGNERVVYDTLTPEDIGIITNDEGMDFGRLLTPKQTRLGILHDRELYQMDRVMYTGITDLFCRKYRLTAIEDGKVYLTTSAETRGLPRKHEMQVLQIIAKRDIVIDGITCSNPVVEKVLLCSMYDESIQDNVIYLFNTRQSSQGRLTGYEVQNIRHCEIYTFDRLPVKQKQIQILVFNDGRTVTKEDLYTALTKAYKRVYFVGSVTGRNSVLEISREVEEFKTGRTLLERLTA